MKSAGYVNDGMGYIIEFKSGEIVVIDGGMLEDSPLVLDKLRRITGEKTPTVDLWFITHPHMDHFFALIGIGEAYSEEIKVKKILYDFPSEEFYKATQPEVISELMRFEAAIDRLEGVERVSIKSGDRFFFGDDCIEVLYTASDLPPFENAPIPQRVNDISAVLRLESAGQRIIFLGDVEKAGNRVMIDRYKDYLKSDVCQIAHHGGGSSTEEFYSYVDPEILLWPSMEPLFWPIYNAVEVNRRLCSGNVKDIILSGHGTRSMPLPIKPSVAPFLPDPDPAPITATGIIKKASREPSLEDMFSEIWDEAEAVDPFCSYDGKRNKTEAEYKLLWTDSALWFRAVVKPIEVFSDPSRHSTTNCNNVRLHLSEVICDDMKKNWALFSGREYLRDLRLYPEGKNAYGGGYNSIPSRCSSVGKTVDGCMIFLASIPFAKPHEKGEVIAFHAELNLLSEPGGYTTLRAMLASPLNRQMYRYTPAALPQWELD